ncbi:methyltransferase domain-containing protein, partial [Streptomyces sp. NPDC057253]|uniref:methyltransferase domain-containing protein n=1 Tax=Streptomyces sp. NPDC057253 TaxID=3346069 RepID=UPI003632C711
MGCGPGTDLPTLAERVGASGTVIGVDRDPALLAQVRRRDSDLPAVQIREADAHALPVGPGTVGRAKINRFLMHVTEPAGVLAQLHAARSTDRSGGAGLGHPGGRRGRSRHRPRVHALHHVGSGPSRHHRPPPRPSRGRADG